MSGVVAAGCASCRLDAAFGRRRAAGGPPCCCHRLQLQHSGSQFALDLVNAAMLLCVHAINVSIWLGVNLLCTV